MVLIQGRKGKECNLKNGIYIGEEVQFLPILTVSRCVVVVVVTIIIIIIIIIIVDQNVLLGPYRNFIYHYLPPPTSSVSNSPKSVSSQVMNCLGHFIWSISSKRWLHHSCSDLLYVNLFSVCNSVWTVGFNFGVAPLKKANSDVSIFLF